MNKYTPEHHDDPSKKRDLYELADAQEEAMIDSLAEVPREKQSSRSIDEMKKSSLASEMQVQQLKVYCLKCAEDLKGLKAGACPSCGREFDPEVPSTISRTPIPIDSSLAEGWATLVSPAITLIAGMVFFSLLPRMVDSYLWVLAFSYPVWLLVTIVLFLKAIKYNKTVVKLFIMVFVGCMIGWPLGVIACLGAAFAGILGVLMQDRDTFQ